MRTLQLTGSLTASQWQNADPAKLIGHFVELLRYAALQSSASNHIVGGSMSASRSRSSNILRGPLSSGFVLSISILFIGSLAPNAMAQTATTPCLQQLSDQKASSTPLEPQKQEKPNWFSRNADKIMGTVGAVGGAVVGRSLCKPGQKTQCAVIGAAGGAFLGSKLGTMLSEADQKRYQEASYKVALTGRPQSLTLDNGCMLVEPAASEAFENRDVDLAFGPGVAVPQTLRSVAEPYVRPTPSNLAAEPDSSKRVTKVGANVPSFVMGSTDSGKTLLLGREDSEQGYVGAGYVDAKGWVVSRDSTPAGIDIGGGQPKVVKVGVEVRCRQISSSIRVEATNKTETVPGKICRLPNGVAESQ